MPRLPARLAAAAAAAGLAASPAAGDPPALSPAAASGFARLALKGVTREFPNKPEHVVTGPADVRGPRALHPAFFGCYDWHSAVHGHWLLVRLLRTVPNLPEAAAARKVLGDHLTADNLKVEADYFADPARRTFERTYGWAWLLKLAEELYGWDDPDGRRWAAAVRPLADGLAGRYVEFLPRQRYPVRTGVHSNTAFGLTFAWDYAKAVGHLDLEKAVGERSRAYFGADRDYPAGWEPSGTDFLSAAVCEADLMRRVLPPAEFPGWFRAFLPGAAKGEPKALFEPAVVTDRADLQLVHLDGLNLSRAWGFRGVAGALPAGDPARPVLVAAADRHAAAALPHVASGDYAGEHWLASFAVYLLTSPR